MKTIGLLGGMSWESTLEYYRILNIETKQILKASHSAKCLMYSYDYYELERLLNLNHWKELEDILVEKACKLKDAGADFLLICANTMHIFASNIEQRSGLKVLHIAKVVKEAVRKKNLKKVLLLGTKYTMNNSFYKDIFNTDHIEVVIPDEQDQKMIHDVIYQELILGKFLATSRQKFVDVINKMVIEGVEGVILGCTEIPLLIKQEDLDIPVFDTTTLHAIAAVYNANFVE